MRSLAPIAVAVLLGGAPWLQAQAPAQELSSASGSPSNTSVHLEGCLFTEAGLSATTPIIIPAGSTQTYILTNGKVIAGSVSDEEAATTHYQLSYGNQAELRSFHGRRVGVVGRVAATPKGKSLEVVSIREISGGCPAMPRRS
jgi:hypothetical protein